MELHFPQEWGAGCPPVEAQGAEGVFYRRVLHQTPSAEDFRSAFEEGTKRFSDRQKCQARGLSVFVAIEDAQRYAELYPATGNLIAQATLDNSDGKTKPTPTNGNTHTTWWPYEGIERHAKFRVLS
jgi:hypothetical protein